MRVLIFGGTGMLGHKLYQVLQSPIDAWVTVRGDIRRIERYGFFCPDRVVGGVDACNTDTVRAALDKVKPDAVVNCIGLVKQHDLGQDPKACEALNGRFPHVLAALCREYGARLVHISTDCVFSGKRGAYREEDWTDAEDVYGRSKAQGETRSSNAVTLRTSIIGRELEGSYGLVEWFLEQTDKPVKGYTQARFSGFTTLELSRVIQRVLLSHASLSGVYHVSSEPIDKRSLLELVRHAYGTANAILPCDEVRIDRTLDSSRFRMATGYSAPSWESMILEMAGDPTPYASWRSN